MQFDVGLKATKLVIIVYFACVVKGEFNTTNSPSGCVSGELCVPACCGPDHTHLPNKNLSKLECTGPPADFYSWEYFESNETHINTKNRARNFSVYHHRLECSEKRLLDQAEVEFSLGLIWNASFILVNVRDKDIQLVPPSNYCIEYRRVTKDGEIVGTRGPFFSVCGAKKPAPTNLHKFFYFTFLIISTICYFISALCYMFVLKVKDIHRKCFVGYSLAFGAAFLFLVLLQLTNTQCNVFGSLFFLFMVCGFLWLAFLCLDLLIEIIFFGQNSFIDRWWWYIGLSIVIPGIVVLSSIIPDEEPDIPNNFLKDFENYQSLCTFQDTNIAIFFVPIGLMMLASLVFLILCIYYIRINNRKYTNQFPWLDSRSQYKYMFRSCLLTWILLLVWILETAISTVFPQINSLYTLYLIESVQGIFALLIFVSNRYTRREIFKKLRKTIRKDNSERLGMLMKTFNSNNLESSRLAESNSQNTS